MVAEALDSATMFLKTKPDCSIMECSLGQHKPLFCLSVRQ